MRRAGRKSAKFEDQANFYLSARSKLDSSLGIPISGMRLPPLDDDHGLSGLSG